MGPRDGLQNESTLVPTPDKRRLIAGLVAAGLPKIEVTAFVSPRWIPALFDSRALTTRLPGGDQAIFTALVPNQRGLDHFLLSGLSECAVFLSASETHNKKNINRSVDEAAAEFEAIVAQALEAGARVRGYLSMVWGCPFEGEIAVERVIALATRLLAMGCYQVSLGDTVGYGTPGQTQTLLSRLMDSGLPPEKLAMHMHDSRGIALANCLVGLDLGITTFDASVGGLGGCPYARGATGNLATGDLVYMLDGLGIESGVDLEKLVDTAELAQALIGRPLPGRYFQARLAERRC